jgi:diaminopropionate ammonia-lyase
VALPATAARLGLAGLVAKDESARFGLPAFKIVGVRYATARLLGAQAGLATTLVAATTGNHGRAVARVARERGLRARLYLPRETEAYRIDALRQEGAELVLADAGYDDVVRQMAAEAEEHGWTIVSDASWDGYEQIPRWIMEGYTRIFDEARAEWSREPDLIVVQAGVGSLAGAAAGWIASTFGAGDAPRFVVAEPDGSACALASLRAGERVSLSSIGATAMAGLRCAEVSPLAWPVIRDVAAGAISVSEAENDAAMARLHAGANGDPVVAAGPSGACGLAAVTRLMTEEALLPMREALGIDGGSRVMAVVTEASQSS